MHTPRPQTISDVIAVLPANVYENPTARGLRWVVRDLLVYAALLAALALVDSWWLLLPLWLLAGLAISGLFILGHDAAHGSLFESKRLCYALGQLCMLPSLHVYEAWCLGHNRIHHAHTVRQSMDYVWHPVTAEEFRGMNRRERLAHRIKWSWLGAGLYYGWDIWWKSMLRFEPPRKIAADVRRDRRSVGAYAALASLVCLGLGAWSYGSAAGAAWMWFKLFGAPFLVFNYVIGWAVYVHHIAPDIVWRTRREWDRIAGQLEGTTVLHMPRWMNFFMHNIFLHVAHHVDMRIPFYQLPRASEAISSAFRGAIRERRYRLSDYIRTTRQCKLFDFDAGRWLTYREALSG